MSSEVASVPVYMRIGDGREIEIGTFSPSIWNLTVPPDGQVADATAEVDARGPLAAPLRAAADVVGNGGMP